MKGLAAGRFAAVAMLVSSVIAVTQVPASASGCTTRYAKVSDVAHSEGGPGSWGELRFTVSTSGCAAAKVSYKTITGPAWMPAATANVDYTPVSGVLYWQVGDTTSRTVTVPVVGDFIVEPDEWLSLELFDPSGLWLVEPIGAGTIVNDDELIIGVIPDGKPHDGFACPEIWPFNCWALVVSSAPAAFDVTVHFATTDGTAVAGQDYIQVPDRILTIPAGRTEVRTWVVILNDGIPEPDEHFYVTIFEPSAGVIGDGEAMLTITSS